MLDPTSITKYVTPLLIPPVMPRKTPSRQQSGQDVDYYEISVEQFQQQVLPAPLPMTTVWGYGAYGVPGTHNFPSFTIEAAHGRPVRVKWINNLIDPATKHYLPHLLAVDQTVHWANPPGGEMHRDHTGHDPMPYTGPVPIVTHVHGAHTTDESDGYTEAWYLPPATEYSLRLCNRGHVVQPLQVPGAGQVRRRLDARLGRLPVSERPARHHPVVPRPYSGHDAPERLRGPGGILPPARRTLTMR